MTQAQWAAELAEELSIPVLQVLDALGSCGLELRCGDGAAAAFWETLINETRTELGIE